MKLLGLFEVKESTVNNPDGSVRINADLRNQQKYVRARADGKGKIE